MEILNQLNKILALPLRGVVFLYQKTLSPDHGPLKIFYPYGYCKFYPSCSTYAGTVLKDRGILGLPKIINRLLRCSPASLGGIDLPHAHDKHI